MGAVVGEATGAGVAEAETAIVGEAAAIGVVVGIAGATAPPHAASISAAVIACRTVCLLNMVDSVSRLELNAQAVALVKKVVRSRVGPTGVG